MPKRRSSSARPGAAAAEFCLVLPLIALLLLGIWEVGPALHVAQIVHNAAREGARRAAAGQLNNEEIEKVVRRYLDTSLLPTKNISVRIENLNDNGSGDAKDAGQLDPMRVTVSFPFDDVRWAVLGRVTSLDVIRGEAVWLSMKDRDFPQIGGPGLE